MAKVTIEQGTLVGGKSSTDGGFEYYEFLKIPYAKPPVGNLRFKSPQPPEPWSGERDATFDDPNCQSLQSQFMMPGHVGAEDCLYLNVFTPQLLNQESKPLPVMVYIHGGGFMGGSGVPKDQSGPDYLIEHNVVVVSINYRLGPLGFLCLDIPEAAGNMGLKDQVMALKWVQKNITRFGGDKNNITIFGISAGGASVEYLCISELSRGLFHKAIPQSGSPLNHWGLNMKIKDLSYKLAETIGCQTKDDKSVLEFLLAAPAQELISAAASIIGFPVQKPTYCGFAPALEKDFGNGDAFITNYPYDIIKAKKNHDVPIMKGFTEFEGLMAHLFKPHLVDELMEKKNIIEYCNHEIDDAENFQAVFRKAYFDDYVKQDIDMPNQSAIDFLGDIDFAGGIWISSQLMSTNKNPVYVYMFAYNIHCAFLEMLINKDEKSAAQIRNTPIEKRGAGHGEDCAFTMKAKHLNAKVFTETDFLIISRYSTMWTNFAKTGNPTPTTNEIIPIQWPRFSAPEWKYLRIDKELTVESDYKPSKMALFQEMYEKYRK